MSYSDGGSEPVPHAVVKVDCAGGLVIEVLYHSDQVGADVEMPHGGPLCCMPYPVERLLEVNEDVIEVLLVLEVLLKICCALLHPGLKPACSSAMIFSACGFSRFRKIFSITLLGWLMRLMVR